MRTDTACLACFLRQATSTARLCSPQRTVRDKVMEEIGRLLTVLDMSLSPPENVVAVYGRIAELTGVQDPYFALKQDSTVFALRLRDQVRQRIEQSRDPLRAAVRYCIAANIIDYGAPHEFDALETLQTCLSKTPAIDDFDRFRKAIDRSPGQRVVYLADNCGELVFDGLLVEQLRGLGCNVTMAVRGGAILNDATIHDAVECGLDTLCRVVSSGVCCPGTPLASCSEEFKEIFAHADLIISKGQGNFETLSEAEGSIAFLFTVKCPVVARHINGMRRAAGGRITGNGEMILMYGGEE
jgi:damage-control phosphatase, subfamily I